MQYLHPHPLPSLPPPEQDSEILLLQTKTIIILTSNRRIWAPNQ